PAPLRFAEHGRRGVNAGPVGSDGFARAIRPAFERTPKVARIQHDDLHAPPGRPERLAVVDALLLPARRSLGDAEEPQKLGLRLFFLRILRPRVVNAVVVV